MQLETSNILNIIAMENHNGCESPKNYRHENDVFRKTYYKLPPKKQIKLVFGPISSKDLINTNINLGVLITFIDS